MSAKLIMKNGDIFNNWIIIEANITKPDDPNSHSNIFSKIQCMCCNKTTRIVKNNQLKHISQKCQSCCLAERNQQGVKPINIGDRFGKLVVTGDGGFIKQNNGKNRHYSICTCDCGTTNFLVRDNSLKTGNTTSCGCILSKGEDEIKQVLLQNNIKFKTDYPFQELTDYCNRKLRFDFIIYNDDNSINRFVEFDGNQHLTGMWGGSWSNLEDFQTIHERDLLKNNFCLDNNYTLVRIPYHKINHITIEDIMGTKYIINKEG